VHGHAGETDVQVCWHVSRDMVCCGSITIFWKWVLFVESVVQVFWLVEVLPHTLGLCHCSLLKDKSILSFKKKNILSSDPEAKIGKIIVRQ